MSHNYNDMFAPSIAPTEEQSAIIYSKENPLKVIAFAGTGKTATLVMKANHQMQKRILYLAFNKSVELEAKGRFGSNVTAKTVHALAYGKFGKKFKLGKLSPYQVSRSSNLNLYDALLALKTLENWFSSADPRISSQHAAQDFLQKYPKDATSRIITAADNIWEAMQYGTGGTPMSHSGYLKLFQLSKPELPYDCVYLDEAQDSNGVTLQLVLDQANSMETTIVGDDFQSIYAWRGAVNALHKINAPSLLLTQSFRFGQEIANVANKLLHTYFAQNTKLRGTGHSTVGNTDIQKAHTIIYRTNAGVFRKACDLVNSQNIYIPGSTEYGDLPIFMTLMDMYHLLTGDKKSIKNPEISCFESFDQVEEMVEQECLEPELSVSARIVKEFGLSVPQKIEDIKRVLQPTPDTAQVVLTTAHKAKGLEWNQVLLGDDFPRLFDKVGDLIPLGYEEGELDPQEVNLLYVAATRAKQNLELNNDLKRLYSYNPIKKPV